MGQTAGLHCVGNLAWRVSDQNRQLEEQGFGAGLLVSTSTIRVVDGTDYSRAVNWLFGRDISRF